MYHCDRCGSSYDPTRAVSAENCPRCEMRDGVSAPLSYRLFEGLPGRRAEAVEEPALSATEES